MPQKARAIRKTTKTGVIRARVSAALKNQAESIFTKIGVNSSDAIRMFYSQVVLQNGMPFEVRIPNALTRKTLDDSAAGKNLTRYADTADMFRKLGIKVGESKTQGTDP